ncbi:Peptidyl-prolyl isomerase cwc27 [Teratosphaeriaceae sp. CCFEE 6253]|nr:Peptidyl-prolyl isomerase cwc27 [Teratosphaeriaceae sp. CCFEE 6253]
MASTYNLEPPPTAKVILTTTAGDLTLELFAKQAPLASRNFLQHCLDGYYTGTLFHRLVPDFVIQGGDPTGTGAGGQSAVNDGDGFDDEVHSRLKFNRRGLLGMAKGEDGRYGSQFFLTLGSGREVVGLTGTCTMFGRVEGETVYNLMKMAEAEMVEGSERPLYPTRIKGAEVLVNFFDDMVARVREAPRTREEGVKKGAGKKRKAVGKNVLSFDGDEEGDTPVVKKVKANPKLVSVGQEAEELDDSRMPEVPVERRKKARQTRDQTPEVEVVAAVALPVPVSKPVDDIESEDDEPVQPAKISALDRTNAEFAALKASMKRTADVAPRENAKPKSALEALIPETSTRGRKRGKVGDERGAIDMFKAFKQRLDELPPETATTNGDEHPAAPKPGRVTIGGEAHVPSTGLPESTTADDDEAQLCDLHFIPACQSCRSWDDDKPDADAVAEGEDDPGWMAHQLSFAKDLLGKDLEWKRRMAEIEVVDPREKARAIKEEGRRGKARGRGRGRRGLRGPDAGADGWGAETVADRERGGESDGRHVEGGLAERTCAPDYGGAFGGRYAPAHRLQSRYRIWDQNEARPPNLQRPGSMSLVDSKDTAPLGHSRPELARQGFHLSPSAFHLMSFHLALTHAYHGDPGLSGGHYVAVAESFPSSHLPLNSRPPPMSLAQSLPPLILGGAGFSYQCHPDPEALPIRDVILQAFDAGVRAIDTSPYYEPSEQLLGKALSSPDITDRYARKDYVLMTKVGRIKSDQVDYSPAWVRKSVARSLERLGTTYLDVVFCHDVEFVTTSDALGAIGELLKLVEEGKVRYVGISGYRIDVLVRVAEAVRERAGKSLDIVQNWGQLNLQNRRLETEGLQALEAAGVRCVLNASPLNIGLLRAEGVPVGQLGDFHPAPQGLRKACAEVAGYMRAERENLAAVALRYALWRAEVNSRGGFRVCTITGISTVGDLTENVGTAWKVLRPVGEGSRGLGRMELDEAKVEKDKPLFDEAERIFGDWMGYGFTSPDPRWSTELKRMMPDESAT